MNEQSGNELERQADYLRDHQLETLGMGDDAGADSLSEVLDSCECESLYGKKLEWNRHGLDCPKFDDES